MTSWTYSKQFVLVPYCSFSNKSLSCSMECRFYQLYFQVLSDPEFTRDRQINIESELQGWSGHGKNWPHRNRLIRLPGIRCNSNLKNPVEIGRTGQSLSRISSPTLVKFSLSLKVFYTKRMVCSLLQDQTDKQ